MSETRPPRIRELHYDDGRLFGWKFRCPACRHAHVVGTVNRKFNGDLAQPTFAPSSGYSRAGFIGLYCHSYVEDGRIRYLPDCQHGMPDTTVDLPPIDANDDRQQLRSGTDADDEPTN